MFFPSRVYAEVTHWTEYHTRSYRWSKTKYNLCKQTFDSKQLTSFFSRRFKHERRYTTPTRYGSYPYRMTVVSPDRSERRVYTFAYYTHEGSESK